MSVSDERMPVAGAQHGVVEVGAAQSSSSRWRTRAAGATMTRAPLMRARQHRSTSSPWKRIARVEAAERAEQVGPHEQARRRDGEHVGVRRRAAPGRTRPARSIAVAARRSGRRRGRRPAGRRRRPRSTSLGPTMPALERYSSSTSTRIASGPRATSSWQMQKKPLSPSTDVEHRVGRRAEAGAGARPPSTIRTNASGSRDRMRSRPASSPASAVAGREQEQRVEVRVVLAGERVERLVEPRAGVVDDDDRDDRRGDRRSRWLSSVCHGASRLAAPSSASRHEFDNNPQHECGDSASLCDHVLSTADPSPAEARPAARDDFRVDLTQGRAAP